MALAMELDPRKNHDARLAIRMIVWTAFMGLAILLYYGAQPDYEQVQEKNDFFLQPGKQETTSFAVAKGAHIYFNSSAPFLAGPKRVKFAAGHTEGVMSEEGRVSISAIEPNTEVSTWTYAQVAHPSQSFIVLLANLIWWGSLAAILGLASHFEGAVILWLHVSHFGRAKEAIMDWHEEREEARKEKEAQRTERAAKEEYDRLDAQRKSVRKEMETIRGSLPEHLAPPIPASLMHYEGYIAEIQKRWKMAQMDRTGEAVAKAMARYKELILEEANLNRAMIELAKTRWESKNLNETFSVMEARLKKERVEVDVDILKAQQARDALQKSGVPEQRSSPDEKAEAQLREEEALRKTLKGRIHTRAELEREVEQEYQKLLKEGWSEERAKEVVEQMRRDLWKALGG